MDLKFILLPTLITFNEANRINLEEYIEDQLIINAGMIIKHNQICYELIGFFKEDDAVAKKV